MPDAAEKVTVELDDPIYLALHKYTQALSVALGYRDDGTRLHSERVQTLAMAIGAECALSHRELGVLRIASAFHDVGKIGTPDEILLKPARLDGAEWEVMKQHSAIGEQIIAATEIDGAREVASVIRHHHERYAGNGYPDGLAEDEIPICSRIITIADSYDAMAVTRSYRRRKTHAEIMKILNEETGSKLDPELMQVFRRVIDSIDFATQAERPPSPAA